MKTRSLTLGAAILAALLVTGSASSASAQCKDVHVTNHSCYHLEIIVNGQHIGCVGPHGCEEFHVDNVGHSLTLVAARRTGCEHRPTWRIHAMRRVYYPYPFYDWHID